MSHPAKLEEGASDIDRAHKTLEWAAHFRRIANAPLRRQDSSDAWGERQSRLAASRDAIKLRLRGIMELNKAKRAAKKKANNGTESSE